MGTSQSAVSEIEAGVTSPTLDTLLRYATAVGGATSDLVFALSPDPKG